MAYQRAGLALYWIKTKHYSLEFQCKDFGCSGVSHTNVCEEYIKRMTEQKLELNGAQALTHKGLPLVRAPSLLPCQLNACIKPQA